MNRLLGRYANVGLPTSPVRRGARELTTDHEMICFIVFLNENLVTLK